MGDPTISVQGPQSEDELLTVQICDNLNGRDANAVSIPICFLVKEQAKSLASIQELHKRVGNIENVQEDVIDAIIKIRNFLSDPKTYSNLNSTRSPIPNTSRLKDFKLSCHGTPESIQVDHETEFPLSTLIPNEADKQLDSAKNKDSALDSDKQDSGLDSDCREHHDILPSLTHKLPNILSHETNDELLQLLDEINYRSTILQQQLATVENTDLAGPTTETTMIDICSQNILLPNYFDSKNKNEVPPVDLASKHKQNFPNLLSELAASQINEVPCVTKESIDNLSVLLKQVDGRQVQIAKSHSLGRKRNTNGIDCKTVSSILKETNPVDLQRYALIYLVDNTVLHTRLREAEEACASKRIESEKIENGLKDEARILMMENRELRISLEEHRIESNSLKSKLTMLERVLHTLTQENQELNWQLGESLNLSNLSKRRYQNLSHSYSSAASKGAVQNRRSSLPSRLQCQSDAHVSCYKSKLLSNASSFLDITVEDAEESPAVHVQSSVPAFGGRILASTPMPSKNQSNNIYSGSFSTAKKSLKFNRFSEKKNVLNGSTQGNISSANTRHIPPYLGEDVPLEADEKFPFNTILEKLKLNAEYKFTRNTALNKDNKMLDSSGNSAKSTCEILTQDTACSIHPSEVNSKGSKETLPMKKKERNIQQRIQSLLDRIVAESDETC